MNKEKIKTRIVNVRKIVGRKNIKNKLYTYEYYTLSLNLYIPKNIIERYGNEFVILKDEEKNTISIIPRRIAEEQGIKIE